MILFKDLSPHANYHRLKMYSHLGYDAVFTVKFSLTFWRNVLPPSSGKSKKNMVAVITSNFFLFDYAEDGYSKLLQNIVKKLPINSVMSQ
jgi:hypothetical protein